MEIVTRIVFSLHLLLLLLLLLILLLLGVALSFQSVAILSLGVIWHWVKHVPTRYLLLHEFPRVGRYWCTTSISGLVLHAYMSLVRLLNSYTHLEPVNIPCYPPLAYIIAP
jgi:hypothetical protein